MFPAPRLLVEVLGKLAVADVEQVDAPPLDRLSIALRVAVTRAATCSSLARMSCTSGLNVPPVSSIIRPMSPSILSLPL